MALDARGRPSTIVRPMIRARSAGLQPARTATVRPLRGCASVTTPLLHLPHRVRLRRRSPAAFPSSDSAATPRPAVRPFPRWALLAAGLGLAAVGLIAGRLWWRPPVPAPPEPVPGPAPEPEAAPGPPPLVFGYPTAQTRLLETNSTDVYMPTASGRIESALYGSVRTIKSGKSFLPSFHEGIDIAPTRRRKDGAALDDVVAVADGEVAYVNRVEGNSDYGLYVVLLHREPAGPLYTLYAHLDEIERGLRPGMPVSQGARLGRMGRTPTRVIPVERSHLHFEVGVMLNSRFRSWFHSKRLTPDHGDFNGWNLAGIDPLAPYAAAAEGRPFRLRDWIESCAPAFEVLVRVRRRPTFFDLYPALWTGPAHDGGPVVVAASHGGVPLSGRNAAPEETAVLGTLPHVVLRANGDVLGRNGRRLVQLNGGRPTLTAAGRQWLEILTWAP